MSNPEIDAQSSRVKKSMKCVIWDLDNTLWEGVLLEDDRVNLRDGVVDIIKTLDSRGILQSIASRNDERKAIEKLTEFGLGDYFLYPQINWGAKALSVESVAKLLNIGIDSVAFIDDQPYERAEVNYSLPDVFCIDAANLDRLLEMPEMIPAIVTEDSQNRRLMYLSELRRKEAEEEFFGPKEEFLATLDMVFRISPAKEEDLQRAEELTLRTNQLNTTGYTYSYDELNQFRQSSDHILLIVSLEDKFGNYGKVGLTLIECRDNVWTIKLMIMSCRVMSRGAGSILLTHILNLAGSKSVRLLAEFISTGRNRMMYVTYKFANFKEAARDGDFILFENALTRAQKFPDYVRVYTED